jgi:carbon monoxide dehydrogenase subunit G
MPESCEGSRIIPAPVQSIWRIMADLSRLKDWLPVQADMQFPNGTEAKPGVVVHVERDSAMGRVKFDQVFDRCDEPSTMIWHNQNETLHGKPITQIKDFTTSVLLEPRPDNSTHVVVRSQWTSVGMMGTIASNMVKPRIRKEYEQALANIEKLAIAGTQPS